MTIPRFDMDPRAIGLYAVGDLGRCSPSMPRMLLGSAVDARRWDLAHRRIETIERDLANRTEASRAPIEIALAELRQLIQKGIEKEFELATPDARALLVRVLHGLCLLELRIDAAASARND